MSEKSTKDSENSTIVEQNIDDNMQNQEVSIIPTETKEKKKKRRIKRTTPSVATVSEETSSVSEAAIPTGKRPKVKRLKPRGVSDLSSKDATKDQLKKEKAEIKKINDELFYTKLVSGLIVGILLGLFIFITDNRDVYVFVIFSMIALLLIVIYIRYVRKIPEEKLSWIKLYLSGTFTYLIVIVVVSSLVWMFLVYFLKGPIQRPGTNG